LKNGISTEMHSINFYELQHSSIFSRKSNFLHAYISLINALMDEERDLQKIRRKKNIAKQVYTVETQLSFHNICMD